MSKRAALATAVAVLACGLPTSTAAAASADYPALPESGGGPAAFAYLCVKSKDANAEPSGSCGSWRVITKDGRIFRVPEALGWEKGPDYGEQGAFAISPDGMRIAFQRAADDRVVVRDLGSGESWTVPYKVSAKSLGSPYTLKFVRDGSQLAITPDDLDAAPVVTLAQVEEGTARKITQGKGLGLLDADPGSGKLTMLSGPGMGQRGAFVTFDGGRKTTAKIPEKAGKHLIWGTFAAHDGRAANLVPKEPPACGPDMTPVWLTTYNTRTGAMKKVRPRLPADVDRADVVDWLNPGEIVVAAARERPGKQADMPVGSYVYAMNVSTGASELIAKLSTKERLYQAGIIAVGGYAAPRTPVAAGEVAKPGKRGCG